MPRLTFGIRCFRIIRLRRVNEHSVIRFVKGATRRVNAVSGFKTCETRGGLTSSVVRPVSFRRGVVRRKVGVSMRDGVDDRLKPRLRRRSLSAKTAPAPHALRLRSTGTSPQSVTRRRRLDNMTEQAENLHDCLYVSSYSNPSGRRQTR